MPSSPQSIDRKILSNPQIARKCGVTTRSLWAWKNDPRLNFPAGMRINDRDYFYEDEVDAWLLERAKLAIRRKHAIIGNALADEVA